MTPERYRQVKAVLVEALALDRDERDAFLTRACGSDAELRREVESLLAEDEAPVRLVDDGFIGRQDLDGILEALHTAEEAQQPSIGETVKQYELVLELGQGGMGQVFLARDTKLGRPVALKFLRLRSSELIERFLSEARATAQCHHENIVVIYEADEIRGVPYIVLEYLDGQPFSELLADGPLEPQRAVQLILPVVRALVCAHDRGIVHRDLKPDNVFLTRSGQVKVLDFGIAKLFVAKDVEQVGLYESAPRNSLLTGGGPPVGTAAYMSPEQWGYDEVDHRTDVWAVGILLWRMLTGGHPIDPPSAARMRATTGRFFEPMPSIRAAAPHLPADLAALVDGCLEKTKAARVESARALLEGLEATLPGLGADAPTEPTPHPEPTKSLPFVLRCSPEWAWGVMFVLGWLLLGASLGLGVGTSYVSSLNWGPNFIVLIPFLAAACASLIQRADDALAGLAGAGLLVDEAGRPSHDNPAFEAWRRRLSWSDWLVVTTVPASVAVSVAEWRARYVAQPVPTEWWTQSPTLAIAGAVVQGLVFGTMVVTWVVMATYGWTLIELATGRLGVKPTCNDDAGDRRGGFGVFQGSVESALSVGGLIYVALWLSLVQSVAIERGVRAEAPADVGAVIFGGPLLSVSPGHYSSQVTVISCLTALSLTGLIVYWLHRAYWAALDASPTNRERTPWLVPRLPLPGLVALLVVAQLCFVFYRLGLGVIAALAVVLVLRAGRRLRPGASH